MLLLGSVASSIDFQGKSFVVPGISEWGNECARCDAKVLDSRIFPVHRGERYAEREVGHRMVQYLLGKP